MASDHRFFTMKCPVCVLELFDKKGVCRDKDGVALTVCRHLVHAKCLHQFGKSVDEDTSERRWGTSAFGSRVGCPVCDRGLSTWMTTRKAVDCPAFWVPKIQKALKDIGPVVKNGKRVPVPLSVVIKNLKGDETLTKEQKDELDHDNEGFNDALWWAGSMDFSVNNVIFASCLSTKGLWRYDQENRDIWLWKWNGVHPRERCANCNKMTEDSRPLKACGGCQYSGSCAYYCSEECQKADRRRHKERVCDIWRKYVWLMNDGDDL